MSLRLSKHILGKSQVHCSTWHLSHFFLSPYFDAKLSENKMLETTSKSVHHGAVPTPQIPSAGDILEKFRKIIKKLPTKTESEKSKCEQCWEH